ncbi:MAG: glycogen debranching protein GlgX [Arenimonas sp.]
MSADRGQAFPPQLPAALEYGRSEPMGAHARDSGVNFAVFSQHATRIDVCVFDATGAEIARLPLHGPHDQVFHGFLPGAGPGLLYGLRADGPHSPEAGHRFNPHKLLLDPCAREIVGHFRWDGTHHDYRVGDPDGLRAWDNRDNAAIALKARVAVPFPGTARPAPPRVPDGDVVLYEMHVKGFSMQLPGIPDALRGTYAALAHPLAIAHLRALGVTTLSLLPVQYAVDEEPLAQRGLRNYWGYNTLGFFCPDPRLARSGTDAAEVVAEFRAMVDALHAAGIEVLLDVVYNHTPEGNEFGPSLSFRGLDQAAWYRMKDGGHLQNLTGCGNTLRVAHPRVAQFVLDSLRYWVAEMGVDGFRFDLAPVLGRDDRGFDPAAAFFTALRQDPVLARARLIAEPWDAGPDGYQLGRFPGRFMEWNDRFRDAVRGYWLRRGVARGELARRFTASSDLFHHHQRKPTASVNFIAVHDGYTLADVVAYRHKHNFANGENNRDGRDGELSDNFGVEGPTDDAAINTLRGRVRRAMLATLVLAQGTPMLCAGDEFGNSQQGNNNAYCQDNALGWLDWERADADQQAFVAAALALRRAEPLLRHDAWFEHHARPGGGASLHWFAADGSDMADGDWHQADGALACRVWPAAPAPDRCAAQPRLALLFNPESHPREFALGDGEWTLALDSSCEVASGARTSAHCTVPAHALVVLRRLTEST